MGSRDRPRGSGQSPIEQVVHGNVLIRGRDQPENDLEISFRALMPQPAMGNERTGPSSRTLQQVQRGFGNPPVPRAGPTLIHAVCEIGYDGNGGRKSPKQWLIHSKAMQCES